MTFFHLILFFLLTRVLLLILFFFFWFILLNFVFTLLPITAIFIFFLSLHYMTFFHLFCKLHFFLKFYSCEFLYFSVKEMLSFQNFKIFYIIYSFIFSLLVTLRFWLHFLVNGTPFFLILYFNFSLLHSLIFYYIISISTYKDFSTWIYIFNRLFSV